MTPDYRLHYAPDNASLCVRLALEEAGLPPSAAPPICGSIPTG